MYAELDALLAYFFATLYIAELTDDMLVNSCRYITVDGGAVTVAVVRAVAAVAL